MRRIRTALILSGSRDAVRGLEEKIGIRPFYTLLPGSGKKSLWVTETVSYEIRIEDPLMELKERVTPALDRIAQARREHDLSVTLLISVYSNYADNPENYIPADYIPFLVDLNAEVRFDLQKGWLRYFKGKLCHNLSVLFRTAKR